MSNKVNVVFTSNAQVRGVGYRRGQEAELDKSVAGAYIRAGQAMTAANYAKEKSAAAKRKVKRGGKAAESASKTTDGKENR